LRRSIESAAHRTAYWLACVCVFLIAFKKPQARPAFDYRNSVGIAVARPDRSCLDMRATLAAGQRIPFVSSTTPQTIGELEITRKSDKSCAKKDKNRPDLNKPGLTHYEFKVIRGSLEKSVPAFALANFRGTLTVTTNGVTGDLDGNGETEFLRSCTSSEGVHLTIWTGKPLEGNRRWHAYYYLGYDVDLNCTAAETKPDMP
jgi:hypothetical protein